MKTGELEKKHPMSQTMEETSTKRICYTKVQNNTTTPHVSEKECFEGAGFGITKEEQHSIRRFYHTVISKFAGDKKSAMKEEMEFVVVAHLVPTLTFYLEALNHIGTIAVVVAKTSLRDEKTLSWLQRRNITNYIVLSPSNVIHKKTRKPLYSDEEAKELNERLEKIRRLPDNRRLTKDSVSALTVKELMRLDGLMFIKKWTSVNKKVVVLDIGGYFARTMEDCLFDSDQFWVQNNLLGVIEDTENGHQKYERSIKASHQRALPMLLKEKITNIVGGTEDPEINDAVASLINVIKAKETPDLYKHHAGETTRYYRTMAPPVVTVARTDIKKSEDFNVGKSIVDAANHILKEHAHTSLDEQQTILVIGYGPIGKAVAHAVALRNHGNILICEKDDVKKLSVIAHSYRLVTLIDGLKEASVVFCCTGSKCLTKKHIPFIKEDAYIASCTSQEDEFAEDFLECLQTNALATNNPIVTYRPQGTPFHMLYNGNAVNFSEKAVNGPSIYGVLASLITSAIRLYIEKLHPPLSSQECHLERGEMNDFAALELRVSGERVEKYQSVLARMLIKEKLRKDPVVSNVIYHYKNVLSRDAEVRQLDVTLQDEGSVKIIGKANTGKSQILQTYYQSNKSKYDIVWSFDANSPISEQCTKLVLAINEAIVQEKFSLDDRALSTSASMDAVCDFLSRHNLIFLLIFEDVDRYSSASAYKTCAIANKLRETGHFIATLSNQQHIDASLQLLLSTYAEIHLTPFQSLDIFEFLVDNGTFWETHKERLHKLHTAWVKEITDRSEDNPEKGLSELIGLVNIVSSFIYRKYSPPLTTFPEFLYKDPISIHSLLKHIITESSLSDVSIHILATLISSPLNERLFFSPHLIESLHKHYNRKYPPTSIDASEVKEELLQAGFIKNDKNLLYVVYHGHIDLLEILGRKESRAEHQQLIIRSLCKTFCRFGKKGLYDQTKKMLDIILASENFLNNPDIAGRIKQTLKHLGRHALTMLEQHDAIHYLTLARNLYQDQGKKSKVEQIEKEIAAAQAASPTTPIEREYSYPDSLLTRSSDDSSQTFSVH